LDEPGTELLGAPASLQKASKLVAAWAYLQTPMGELTALPRLPSWWQELAAQCPPNPNPALNPMPD